MSWAKLDDGMGEHRKVTRALRKSRPAVALHFLGILHCSRYLTDGFVEDEYINEVLTRREREPALAVLVDQGLWTAADGGYNIHDYLDHNPSRSKVLEQRRVDAERKAKGRKSESRGKPDAVQADSDRTPDGVPAESDRPVPSRPVPSSTPNPASGGLSLVGSPAPVKPTGNRSRDHEKYEAQIAAWAAAHFPGSDPSAVGNAVSFARPTPLSPINAEQVERWARAAGPIWTDQLGLTSDERAA